MYLEFLLDDLSTRVFGLVCHQIPSILIDIGGRDVALCPRCIGLHVGFFASFILLFIRNRFQTRLRL